MYPSDHDFEREREQEQPIPTTGDVSGEEEAPKQKKTRRHTGMKVAALCLCCALLGGVAGLAGTAVVVNARRGETTVYHAQTPVSAVEVVDLPASEPLSPAQVYAGNVASCVGITVSTTTNIYGYTTTSAATGSGFVLTADGYVVTNYHVIEKAAKDRSVPITVSFQNGSRYQAKLVGGEADNDVAVLKIDAKELKSVVLGDSGKLIVGESVFAIGNPLGELTYSLTDGIVSALDRVITTGSGNDANSMNMLQTNCAINSGNSGGPLFNRYGQVIGITTAKMSGASSSSATIEGLGFAIPINDVKHIIEDLIRHGYVTGKPYLGVRVSSVTEADAKRYGVPVGAYVEAVEEGSCAQKAGLKVGDIITSMDDTVITTHSALVAAKATYRAGDTMILKVVREGKQLELSVVLDEEAPEQTRQPDQPTSTQPKQNGQSGGNSDDPFQWPFGSFFNFGFPF